MNAPENRRFEKEWEMAFEGKEISPSDKLWDGIELHLARNENEGNKRRLLFFKLMAAASISFAMIVGTWEGYQYYTSDQSNSTYSAKKESAVGTSEKVESSTSNDLSNTEQEGNSANTIIASNDARDNENISKENISNRNADNSGSYMIGKEKNLSKTKSGSLIKSNDETNQTDNQIAATNIEDNGTLLSELSKLFTLSESEESPKKITSLQADLSQEEPEMADLRMVPWYSQAQTKKKSSGKSLWTGINMSAGTFDPNVSSNSSANVQPSGLVSDVENTTGNENVPLTIGQERSGTSLGVGVNIGSQISEKVVIFSGLNYLQQTTSSSSNVVANAGQARAVSSYNQLSSSESLAITNDYEIENTYESVSIPVQAGYYLLDRKFNILLTAGVANDFF
ncbi:MAG: hypothetical protein RLO81_11125, partial [Fulvivirga sp.]|uniref:hypothetical protein n=1 Tax=Fulvivirga sp. TaxID=1931237 RepID=UPI0032EBA675